MIDYAAAPLQPIVQGLVTFPGGPGGPVVFTGRGVIAVVRDIVAGGQGGYFLHLDPGLPGNAGAVPPQVSPLTEPIIITQVTPRGTGAPPMSGIATKAVAYFTSATAGVGAPVIEIVLTDRFLAPTDPVAGFEVIVFRGF